ncbi:serine hydrolase [Cohnella sp. GbtcB17]|uniref:serine hydrolase domain-containing protein n=1 Tax=Cohnella sp. GbtcB17 TaxID=2824762 RepID=UPI0027D26B4C|nr:serine hydrolase [Cohnella sp. GbtcB17]
MNRLRAAIVPYSLRSCLVSRQGRLIFEQYRDPDMAQTPAKINSCTKSVLSMLLCIAIDRGVLPAPAGAPVSLFFPQLALDPDTRKREMTLLHLLTMTSGIRWQEFGGLNSFPRMTHTPDWVGHVLEQPLSEAPGHKMTYNSGVSQLLSAILSRAADMTVAAFAERALFGPLGIDDYAWETDPQGIHTGGFGLRLRPADMLKLGQLQLQRGRWEGHRLYSAELADAAVQPVVQASPPYDGAYAWHWWCGTYTPGDVPDKQGASAEPWDVPSEEHNRTAQDSSPSPSSGADAEGLSVLSSNVRNGRPGSIPYYYARGFGGQFIYVVPQAELVAVLTQDSRKRKQPDWFAEVIGPALFPL